jgi:hypothetical protein
VTDCVVYAQASQLSCSLAVQAVARKAEKPAAQKKPSKPKPAAQPAAKSASSKAVKAAEAAEQGTEQEEVCQAHESDSDSDREVRILRCWHSYHCTLPDMQQAAYSTQHANGVVMLVLMALQDIDWDAHPPECIIGHTSNGKVSQGRALLVVACSVAHLVLSCMLELQLRSVVVV